MNGFLAAAFAVAFLASSVAFGKAFHNAMTKPIPEDFRWLKISVAIAVFTIFGLPAMVVATMMWT